MQAFNFLFISILLACQVQEKLNSTATLITGAEVFIDKQWQKRDFYIYNDTLYFDANFLAEDTINIEGKYVTPGFVDAHTHNLDRTWQRGLIKKYLAEGTLAVQNLTSKSKGVEKFRKLLDSTASPIVKYSNWGFTSTLGHPFTAYEPYASGIREYKSEENSKRLDTSRVDLYNSYAFVDSVSQLETIWPAFLETEPDLVKIYFFNEDEIEKQIKGNHGLRFEVAKAIIDSAHKSNLRVFAHIGNSSDFEKMLNAGVDGFAHSPEYSWKGDSASLKEFKISDNLLEKASKNNVVINPTAAGNYYWNKNNPELLKQVAMLQTDRIRRFRELGGIIAPGSDAFNRTGEVLYKYYAQYIDLPADEKLSIFTEESSEAIFPDHKIGKIAEGYLANFLVFESKPFENNSWNKPQMVFVEGEQIR